MSNSDSAPPSRPSNPPAGVGVPTSGRQALLARYPWLGFVLPLVVFLAVTSLEPTPPPVDDPKATPAAPDGDQSPTSEQAEPTGAEPRPTEPAESPGTFGLNLPYSAYPTVYTLKVLLSIAAIAFCWPTYQQFAWKLSPLAFLVGVVGVALWVGICHLGLEHKILPAIGLGSLLGSGQRSAFNPLVELAGQPGWAWGFLTIRFVGLALVVPLIEEFFLRGFLMRACVREDWTSVPFGTINLLAVIAGTAVPMLMHPGELFAAFVWFSMITGLMVMTRNIWDCVVAHATTNLLLGMYVVIFNQWQLM